MQRAAELTPKAAGASRASGCAGLLSHGGQTPLRGTPAGPRGTQPGARGSPGGSPLPSQPPCGGAAPGSPLFLAAAQRRAEPYRSPAGPPHAPCGARLGHGPGPAAEQRLQRAGCPGQSRGGSLQALPQPPAGSPAPRRSAPQRRLRFKVECPKSAALRGRLLSARAEPEH